MINENERYFEYVLIQHPHIPEKRMLKWKFKSIDHWLEEDE
ncbi:MAG: hypothetical protein ACFFD2_23720 [Promethearchaeota archaeon]